MSSATRENRIMEAVPCPKCGARLRVACATTHDNRPIVCTERRIAWQAHTAAGITRWVVSFVIDTPHLAQSDEENAHNIAHAVRHHLHAAKVNVVTLPQVTPERPLLQTTPCPKPKSKPLRTLRQIK